MAQPFSGSSNPSGATPPGGGNLPLESRVARLEIRMEHVEQDIAEIKTDMRSMRHAMDNDFRITWAGIIALGIGLSGLMAKGFGWL